MRPDSNSMLVSPMGIPMLAMVLGFMTTFTEIRKTKNPTPYSSFHPFKPVIQFFQDVRNKMTLNPKSRG